MKHEPQQMKECRINLELALKGLDGVSREGWETLSGHYTVKQQALDCKGSGGKKKKKKEILNVFDENVASCMFDTILYY